MKINNFFPISENISYDKNNFLKEGSIIYGDIIDIEDTVVFLKLPGCGVIKAESESDIQNMLGKKTKFLIKTIDENKIQLKPILNKKDVSVLIKKGQIEEDIITNILNKYDIVNDEISRKLVKTLSEFNLPVTKENMEKCLNVFDKLDQIYNKKDTEKVIILKEEDIIKEFILELKEENIAKEEISEAENKINPKIVKNILLNNDKLNKLLFYNKNISDFLVVPKGDYLHNSDLTFIFEDLFNEIPKEKMDTQLFKILAYFIKKDIDISLNNVKNFHEFIENPKQFSESLCESMNYFKKEIGRFKITFTPEDIKQLDNYYTKLEEQLIKLYANIEKNSITDEKSIKHLNNIGTKIEFLKDVNEHLALFHIPIQIADEKNHTGVISLMTKNKNNKNTFQNVSVFIDLNMSNIGNARIYCQINCKNINITFDIEEENIKLFQYREENLKEVLMNKGFKVNKINYIMDEKVNIMNTLIVNKNPLYYLDVQV